MLSADHTGLAFGLIPVWGMGFLVAAKWWRVPEASLLLDVLHRKNQ
jgi:hypothetical protein